MCRTAIVVLGRWVRAQDSLHDIIGEDEDAREKAVQEDENKVDDMKGDVEEIRSWHADDTTNEHELKTLSLSHNAWSSSPHEKNSRCEVWFSHTPVGYSGSHRL